MATFRMGCAVWSYRGWLGDFFPTGTGSQNFLKLYGDRLHAVEGNTTFYAVPSVDTVKRWRDQTPENFRFCLKFPRPVTHDGLLMPRLNDAKAFLERVSSLGDRLGCVFTQLPPNYSPAQAEDLQDFLSSLNDLGIQLGVETRHLRWFNDDAAQKLTAWLTANNITKVLLDTRPIYNCSDNPQAQSQRKKPNVPLQAVSTSHQVIVRFISHPDAQYTDPYLDSWIPQLKQWIEAGKEIYFFVHCPIEDYSPAITKRFQTKLEAAQLTIPPLPWNEIPPEPEQLTLF